MWDEVYNADHKFVVHILEQREKDGSINMSTIVMISPIFKALDHMWWEEERSKCCSLFCIPTGPWDRPPELKKICTTIWQKGYSYFLLVAFNQHLGSHTILVWIHTEEALQQRKTSEGVHSTSKWLKELVFCPWCGLTQQQNQALIHHLLEVHYKMCWCVLSVGIITPLIWTHSAKMLRMNKA